MGAGDVNESLPQFDHLIIAVADPEPVGEYLADEWGLHVHTDTLVFGDGLANLIVPLESPQYLEILYVHDRAIFDTNEGLGLVDLGPRQLNCRGLPHVPVRGTPAPYVMR